MTILNRIKDINRKNRVNNQNSEIVTPAIQIHNLYKSYGNVRALKGIDLTVEKGQFFGLLGPNGAGKTTTINIITGLVTFSKGNVRVLGKDVVKNYRWTRSKIGVSQQEYNFDPFFNIRTLLILQAGYYGVPRRQAKRRVDYLLHKFGLWEKRKGNYRKLSGGMKRILQLMKALVHDPEILILDEPTAGVDVELRHKLWDYFTELNQNGKTIILTTHYIEEADRLCSEIAIINEGKIIASGHPETLKSIKGKGTLELRLLDKLKKPPEFLDYYDAELSENVITIRMSEPQKYLQGIIELFNMHNLRIDEINIHQHSLEETFLDLTMKKRPE